MEARGSNDDRPRALYRDRSAALPDDTRGQPMRRPRGRVLVAEDDRAMRDLITSLLRDAGYDVVEACDGAQLLDRIGDLAGRLHGRHAIELIISDIRMPGLTGLDVLAALRVAYWRTPVILITAFGDEESHAEANQLGALAVLDKPFALEELLALVRRTVPPC